MAGIVHNTSTRATVSTAQSMPRVRQATCGLQAACARSARQAYESVGASVRIDGARLSLARDRDCPPTITRAALDGRRRRNRARVPAAAAPGFAPVRSSYGHGVADEQVHAGILARGRYSRARLRRRPRFRSDPVPSVRAGARNVAPQFIAGVCVTHPGPDAGGCADQPTSRQRSRGARTMHSCGSHAVCRAVRGVAVGRGSQWPSGSRTGGSWASAAVISYEALHRTERSLGSSN